MSPSDEKQGDLLADRGCKNRVCPMRFECGGGGEGEEWSESGYRASATNRPQRHTPAGMGESAGGRVYVYVYVYV